MECRDVALARGQLPLLAYGLSHLALLETLAADPTVGPSDRLLVLDDLARPRQGWLGRLGGSAVPRDWDILALAWWGNARGADKVPGADVYKAVPPFRDWRPDPAAARAAEAAGAGPLRHGQGAGEWRYMRERRYMRGVGGRARNSARTLP